MSAEPGRLRELFLAARHLEAAQREAFLATACPDDAALRAEALALLAAVPLPDRSVAEVLADGGMRPIEVEPGVQFGRFTLLAHLGSGGMGRVDRAFDPRSRRQVAIKRLKTEWLANPDAVTRFAREVRAASRLEVRGLCPVFEVGDVDGALYCVMPVVQGETLDARLRKTAGRPDATAIRDHVARFEKIARALHCAHEAGLVHRDIKPGNIMIQPDGEPVVLDFGLVQDQQDGDLRLTRTGQLPGTPSYMAPEQVRGIRTDCRADIHALGVTLFECVCGSRPFVGESSVELFAQIQDLPLPKPRRRNRAVPSGLAVVLAVATEKAPERRYRSAAQMADDLARVLAHQPVHARRQPLWIRLRGWVARNKTASAILFVVAVGLLVTLGMQLERAAINTALRRTIRNERNLQETANALRAAGQDRLDDFEGLAVLGKTATAVAAARGLQPPWPERIAAMEGWLAEHGAAMAPGRDRIAATLERLRARAEAGPSGTAPALQDEAAEWNREIGALELRIASLRTAVDLRMRVGPLPSFDLPAEAPEDAKGLLAAAWPWVDPERPSAQFGKERLALAYLAHALERAGREPIRWECAYALLWALVATGADMGEVFPPEVVTILDAAPPPAQDPDRYRNALLRADAARRMARSDLSACEAQRAELLDRQREPWAHRLPEAERVLAARLQEGRAVLEQHLGPVGVRQRVLWNLDWARRIETLTAAHPRARVSWREARTAIAAADGVTASKEYAGRGVQLEPVLGFVPIGMNPVTRLWEFYDLRSAFDPRSGGDPAALPIPEHRPDGSIEPHETNGMVFVLLPGGQVVLGDQGSDRTGRNYCEQARGNEKLHEVDLAPFFLARHEMTQAQWMRLSLTDNPSAVVAGTSPAGQAITAVHPVESVSPHQGHDLLSAFGMRLPGEWEWEYACRAGTTSPWSSGPQAADLEGHANLADLSNFRYRGAGGHLDFDDGFIAHAPVGSFAPNAFGIYDLHGNVAEPCAEPDEGLPTSRRLRGGHWLQDQNQARSSYRGMIGWEERSYNVGVRAARSLR